MDPELHVGYESSRCSPGFDTTFQLPFKIIGRGGVDINEKWKPHPVSYLSVAVDGFPNMFMALGPNSGLASGMLTPLIEHQVMYAVQATAKLQRDRLKSMEVKPEAVRDFDQYIDVRPRTCQRNTLHLQVLTCRSSQLEPYPGLFPKGTGHPARLSACAPLTSPSADRVYGTLATSRAFGPAMDA